MPEISLFLFDLEQLFKLFPKEDKDLNEKFLEYEINAFEQMAKIRVNLFKSAE